MECMNSTPPCLSQCDLIYILIDESYIHVSFDPALNPRFSMGPSGCPDRAGLSLDELITLLVRYLRLLPSLPILFCYWWLSIVLDHVEIDFGQSEVGWLLHVDRLSRHNFQLKPSESYLLFYASQLSPACTLLLHVLPTPHLYHHTIVVRLTMVKHAF